MIRPNQKNLLRFPRVLGVLTLCIVLPVAVSLAAQGNSDQSANPAKAPQPWETPASAVDVKNPVPPTPENVAAGKDLYEDNCLSCHGDGGAGDGIAGQSLRVKPANFTDAKLMKAETDGSLFWKMTTGRGPMPSWKDNLTETQRWQLVDYIRTFAKAAAAEKAGEKSEDKGDKTAAPSQEPH